MLNRFGVAAMSLAAMLVAPQFAGAQTFKTVGSMNDNGAYGNALIFTPTDKTSSLQMRVTGWQSNQTTNAITTAYVGAYGPGLGVTGINDQLGGSGYHQVDNAGGYTDFVLLQFNAPVALTSLTLNSFTMGSAKTKDNDLAFYAASVPETSWNAPIDLTRYVTSPSLWTSVAGSGADGSVSLVPAVLSREWLVGAGFNSNANDAFKIASVTVTSAVPEPASWAMMILGAGLIGFSLRARRSSNAAPAPAAA
jgi:hypothetical protein